MPACGAATFPQEQRAAAMVIGSLHRPLRHERLSRFAGIVIVALSFVFLVNTG